MRDARGRFAVGNTLSPGRPKGSANKFPRDFVDAIHRAFLERGEEVIRRVMDEKPDAFLQVCGRLIPRDLSVVAERQLVVLDMTGVSPESLPEREDGEDV